jgi:hypothetical protein
LKIQAVAEKLSDPARGDDNTFREAMLNNIKASKTASINGAIRWLSGGDVNASSYMFSSSRPGALQTTAPVAEVGMEKQVFIFSPWFLLVLPSLRFGLAV